MILNKKAVCVNFVLTYLNNCVRIFGFCMWWGWLFEFWIWLSNNIVNNAVATAENIQINHSKFKYKKRLFKWMWRVWTSDMNILVQICEFCVNSVLIIWISSAFLMKIVELVQQNSNYLNNCIKILEYLKYFSWMISSALPRRQKIFE